MTIVSWCQYSIWILRCLGPRCQPYNTGIASPTKHYNLAQPTDHEPDVNQLIWAIVVKVSPSWLILFFLFFSLRIHLEDSISLGSELQNPQLQGLQCPMQFNFSKGWLPQPRTWMMMMLDRMSVVKDIGKGSFATGYKGYPEVRSLLDYVIWHIK